MLTAGTIWAAAAGVLLVLTWWWAPTIHMGAGTLWGGVPRAPGSTPASMVGCRAEGQVWCEHSPMSLRNSDSGSPHLLVQVGRPPRGETARLPISWQEIGKGGWEGLAWKEVSAFSGLSAREVG